MINSSVRQAKKPLTAEPALLKRADRSQLRHRQILEAAKRCFARIGFHSTSMAQIAAEARMSVGQIYRHFPSKESLIEGIVEEDVAQQLDVLQNSLKTGAADMVTAIRSRLDDNPSLANRAYIPLMLEIVAEAARNPKIRKIVLASQLRGHEFLKKRIAALSPRAWPPGELDLRLRLIYAVVAGVSTQTAVGASRPSAALLTRLAELTQRLLTPEPL
jgi:TetR/AcrR family transcriptional repressor of uid operon